MVAREADMQFVRDAVQAEGSLHAFAAKTEGAGRLSGRGAAYAIDVDGRRWVVRHYHRGGAVAALLYDRYLRGGTPRPIAELIVSEAARARGIATPRVTAATIHVSGSSMFYRCDIATTFLPQAADLYVLTLGARPWPDDEREAAWRAAGALLCMSFENGLVHPDLNLKNILVEKTGGGVVAHVIDLDRAHLGARVSASQRGAMLARFERSRAKLEQSTGRAVRAEELRAFHEGLGA